MGISGTYKYDKKLGKVVKISDRIPKLHSKIVGRVDDAYYDPGLGTVVKNTHHKRELLKRTGSRVLEPGEIDNRKSFAEVEEKSLNEAIIEAKREVL